MMNTLYVAVLTYTAPIEEVEHHLPAHMEWLEKGYAEGAFIASGRRVPRTGGIILAKGSSLEAVESRLQQDPFQLHGVASVDVYPFVASKHVEALEGLF